MSCDCLARLLAAMDAAPGDEWSKNLRLIDMRQFIRAARREAGPTCVSCGKPLHDSTGMCPTEQCQGSIISPPFRRAQAWEKWAREVAVPTLERYNEIVVSTAARDALASRPKDA